MKPWLFLDVDGVVSPIPPDDHKGNPVPPPGYWTYEGAPWRMYFPDGLVAWLWDLDRSFDVRWLTSWEDGILKVAQRIGAPTWDWLPLGPWTARGSRVSRKAAPIVGLISHDLRPLAWVDDHHRAVGWVPERLADVAGGLPTLILKPRTHVGSRPGTATCCARLPSTPPRRLRRSPGALWLVDGLGDSSKELGAMWTLGRGCPARSAGPVRTRARGGMAGPRPGKAARPDREPGRRRAAAAGGEAARVRAGWRGAGRRGSHICTGWCGTVGDVG